MRDGFGPDSTWIEFNSGPYLAKHDHLDQNHFSIYHKGLSGHRKWRRLH